MGQKIEVSREAYEQIREFEASKGIKLTDAEWMFIVPECVHGIFGVYQITRCYKSFGKYYGSFRLIEATRNKEEAENKVDEYMK